MFALQGYNSTPSHPLHAHQQYTNPSRKLLLQGGFILPDLLSLLHILSLLCLLGILYLRQLIQLSHQGLGL